MNPLSLRRKILVLLLTPVLGQVPVVCIPTLLVRILEPFWVVLEQITPTHPAVLARRRLRVLRLAQCISLGFLLVHSRLFPFGECLRRDGSQIRSELVSLRMWWSCVSHSTDTD